jgi:hypothetical protein
MAANDETAREGRVRTIQRVRHSSSKERGQSIELDVEYSDGKAESFRVPYERAPTLVHAIVQASVRAEKERKLLPGQSLKSVSAYSVRACEVLTSADDKLIAIQFQTTGGFPVQVVMPKEIAENLHEGLGQQLALLGRRSPQKLS